MYIHTAQKSFQFHNYIKAKIQSEDIKKMTKLKI